MAVVDLQNWMKEAKAGGWPMMRVLQEMTSGTRFADLEGLYCTNVCKCKSYDKWDTGLSEATGHCAPYLERELQLLQPQAIVTFGRRGIDAVASFTGVEVPPMSMNDLHCREFVSPRTGQKVLVLQHWGRRRGSCYYEEIHAAFARFVETLQDRGPPS